MNIGIMMGELVKELEKATVNLRLSTPKGQERAPQVVDGYLPPKNPKDPQCLEDFPYVIARYLEDEETDDDATAKVKIICGAFSEDDKQGWRDLLNLTDAIKTYLLSHRLFGKCFEIKLPFKREFPEEQQVPGWDGWITLNITTPSILGVNEDVERILRGEGNGS